MEGLQVEGTGGGTTGRGATGERVTSGGTTGRGATFSCVVVRETS